jgi:hypothetical protein
MTSASDHCIVFKLVGECVQAAPIQAGEQTGGVRLHPVGFSRTPRAGRGEAAPQGIVDDLLQWLSHTVDLIFDHPRHVGIEGQSGAHSGIMMPT